MSIPETQKIKRIGNLADEVKDVHPTVKRLFDKLPGVLRVEYTHGKLENGADFIISKSDGTLDVQVYVGVIVKRGNINKPEVHTIINQVRECQNERPNFGGKQKIFLSEIWVVTTGTIGEFVKDTIHEQFKTSNVQFIDRDHLIGLLDKYLPSFWTDIDVHAGDYLSKLFQVVAGEDKELTLIPNFEQSFYIEQEIVRLRTKKNEFQKRKLPKLEKINVYSEIEANNFLLIEGEAGVGKSKCAREIVKHYCASEVFNSTHIIPIKLRLQKLTQDFSGKLEKVLKSELNEYQELIADDHNNYLFIIDGLDEVKQTTEEAAEQIKNFEAELAGLPRCKLVLLSRTFSSEYGQALVVNNVVRLEILPLSINKTIDLIKKLCSELVSSGRLFEDLKSSALFKQLPRSPIAAILLARILREQRKDLPSSLPELYERYFEIALGRWDIDKGLQSEKEYAALDAILMEIAAYFMDNELEQITYEEALNYFKDYLSRRNLGLHAESLIDLAGKRCPVLRVNRQENRFSFRHRTFAEFMYAKKISKLRYDKILSKAYEPYWLNTVYFFVGLKRDCPELLDELFKVEVRDTTGSWSKAFGLSDLMLAAYATPYECITRGMKIAALEAAKLHKCILMEKNNNPFLLLPHAHALWILQHFFKQRYSYEFLEKAIPEAACDIAADVQEDLDLRQYAVFFLCAVYVDMGGKNSFDWLLSEDLKPLPLPLSAILGCLTSEMPNKSKLLRKHEKRIIENAKNNPKLRNEMALFFEQPLNKDKKLISK